MIPIDHLWIRDRSCGQTDWRGCAVAGVSNVKRNLMITGNYHPSKFDFREGANSMHSRDEDLRSST